MMTPVASKALCHVLSFAVGTAFRWVVSFWSSLISPCLLYTSIIKEGEDLSQIVIDTVLDAANSGEFTIQDRDVLAVTESILARSQANYATKEQIAADVKAKLGGETIGVIFPILSRNRFAICLRGIAKGAKKVILMRCV